MTDNTHKQRGDALKWAPENYDQKADNSRDLVYWEEQHQMGSQNVVKSSSEEDVRESASWAFPSSMSRFPERLYARSEC